MEKYQFIWVWLILGFGSGVAAKYILPGKDKGGLITTTLIGVVGAFVGGFLGKYFGVVHEIGGLSIMSVLTAVAGSIVLLILMRVVKLLI